MLACAQCGTEIIGTVKFCSECGAKVESLADEPPKNPKGDGADWMETTMQAAARDAWEASAEREEDEMSRLVAEVEGPRFYESHYLIREKHMTWGSQAWVLNESQQVLLFAREAGSYSREFYFFVGEEQSKTGKFPLIHVEPTAKGVRGLQGADFVIRDWQDEELFSVSRKLTSMNRSWRISTPDGKSWGRAFEGGGTSVARRVPFVRSFTVLSMEVQRDDGRKVASFARKRMSLGDVYKLDVHDDRADRRLLIALGVLFETIHD